MKFRAPCLRAVGGMCDLCSNSSLTQRACGGPRQAPRTDGRLGRRHRAAPTHAKRGRICSARRHPCSDTSQPRPGLGIQGASPISAFVLETGHPCSRWFASVVLELRRSVQAVPVWTRFSSSLACYRKRGPSSQLEIRNPEWHTRIIARRSPSHHHVRPMLHTFMPEHLCWVRTVTVRHMAIAQGSALLTWSRIGASGTIALRQIVRCDMPLATDNREVVVEPSPSVGERLLRFQTCARRRHVHDCSARSASSS